MALAGRVSIKSSGSCDGSQPSTPGAQSSTPAATAGGTSVVKPIVTNDSDCTKNSDCTGRQLCQFPDNKCQGSGVCVAAPGSCPTTLDPVCGCDGIVPLFVK